MIGASLRRRRGPLVRYWTADWRLMHTEPVKVETWPHWARHLPARLLAVALRPVERRRHRRHVHVARLIATEDG